MNTQRTADKLYHVEFRGQHTQQRVTGIPVHHAVALKIVEDCDEVAARFAKPWGTKPGKHFIVEA